MTGRSTLIRRRVVKLGGSLFCLPDLVDRFGRWRGGSPAIHDIVIVGGGESVEQLRVDQQTGGISEESAHWQALHLMSLNAANFAQRLENAKWSDDVNELFETTLAHSLTVFDPLRWLSADRSRDALPQSWDVTSDSIAARVAVQIAADELVLVKSVLPDPRDTTCRGLVASGYVDRYFDRAAETVPVVRCVDLRSSPFCEQRIGAPAILQGA